MFTDDQYLNSMVSRPYPTQAPIVQGSTPVPAFGVFKESRIATLGINPSDQEFLDKNGVLLQESSRRFETLQSLGAKECSDLSETQVQRVLDSCSNYFKTGNDYRKWFKPLDEILMRAFGVSYYADTACHLDLVQWATLPKWSSLPKEIQRLLLDEGVPYLRTLLQQHHISHVVVNGNSVWQGLKRSNLLNFDDVGVVYFGAKNTSCKLRVGFIGNIQFLGWSSNIQSGYGSNERVFCEHLADWLKETAT